MTSVTHSTHRRFSNFSILCIPVNKRLDEWVPEDYLDTRKVQFPRKDGTTTGQNTGATTPKKHLPNIGGISLTSVTIYSRPSSPKLDNDNELVNGSEVMAAALQKKINRKRKVCTCFGHLCLPRGSWRYFIVCHFWQFHRFCFEFFVLFHFYSRYFAC